MKFIAVAAFALLSVSSQAQLGGLIKSVTGQSSSALSSDDVGAGLKQALSIGVQNGATKLSAVNGYFGNAAIKILLPPDAQKLEKTLRGMGMNQQVDDAITAMNRAAEDAAKSAAPIFANAITSMSITDAFSILKGGDTAATAYLRTKTTAPLTVAFKPSIDTSLKKVDATKYWNTLTTTYNKIPLVKKVNTDLTAYVTQKALDGMFYQVALEEAKIRTNPAAQVTDLLKKVFGGK